MQTLLTPRRAAELAFADGEQAPAGAITAADTATAEIRHILPAIGRTLYDKLAAGAYPELLSEYLAPAIALYARLAAQPRLDIATLPGGAAAPSSGDYRPAGDEAVRRRLRALREEARTLLRRATDHLDACNDAYPEYDPRRNVLKRCRIDGDLVQTL